MPSSLLAVSLRLACTLAMATGIAACQTSQMNPNHPDYQIIHQKVAPPGNDEQESLTMDMSGRHEYQLENGLKIVIKEDHRAPVAMTQIWYRVGSTVIFFYHYL